MIASLVQPALVFGAAASRRPRSGGGFGTAARPEATLADQMLHLIGKWSLDDDVSKPFITDDVRDACLVPIELEWLNDKICLMEECPVELPEAFAAAWERVKFQGEGCVTVNGLAAEIRSHSS